MEGLLEAAAFLGLLCAQIGGIIAIRDLPPDPPRRPPPRAPAAIDRRAQIIELGGG